MSLSVARLRMFAGPNGSGKSTIKSVIRPEMVGVYVNPDELEKEIQERGFLDVLGYSVQTTDEEMMGFFRGSSLLQKAALIDDVNRLSFADGKLSFHDVAVNAYFASAVADFLRRKLLDQRISFTCETVMSSPDKIAMLETAQCLGYRTYLYYVATEDPKINISRVLSRVHLGGHGVPEDKIVSRYARSLELLMEAICFTNRAYIFDNSNHEVMWVAELTNGKDLDMKTARMPVWFKKAVWDKVASSERPS